MKGGQFSSVATWSVFRRRRHEELARTGFTGTAYEFFTADLAAYGYPVIRSWLRRGLIFEYCAQRVRPVPVSGRDRLYLTESSGEAGDDRKELALETNARALRFFREHALLSGTWTFDGGASLNTFYIGACLFAFPNVFQRWAGERRRSFPTSPSDILSEDDMWSPVTNSIDIDPAVSVTSAITVATELKAMPERTREAAARVVLNGSTFAEVGAEIGLSERAVEGRLYRYRTEALRRQLRGRLG